MSLMKPQNFPWSRDPRPPPLEPSMVLPSLYCPVKWQKIFILWTFLYSNKYIINYNVCYVCIIYYLYNGYNVCMIYSIITYIFWYFEINKYQFLILEIKSLSLCPYLFSKFKSMPLRGENCERSKWRHTLDLYSFW